MPNDEFEAVEPAGEDVTGSMQELRELVEFLKASAIAEFDLERPNLKLRLKFQGTEPAASPIAQPGFDLAQLSRLMASQPQAAVPSVAPAVASAAVVAEVSASAQNHIVKSPLVGTLYESSAPGAAPFVKIGDIVEVGQVLCIVEAMKLMNEIESDAAGEVVARIAANGQPVEYGQPLFEIKVR